MTVSWLKPIWQSMARRIHTDELNGGFLLLGDPGLGALPLAKAFAGLLLCETGGGSACGNCSACRWVEQGQHPDLITITPDESTGIIKVDTIRELSDSLTQKASRGGYQVVIISSADALNIASSNALLKTLEEPPGQVVFFLCCEEKRSLLPTILSRCEQLTLPVVSFDQAESWLKEKHPNLSNLAQYLRWAKGAPYAVADLMEAQYQRWRDQLLKDIQDIAMNKSDALALVSGWQKASVPLILDILASLISDLLRLRAGGDISSLMHQDVYDSLCPLSKAASSASLWSYYDYLLEMRQLSRAGSLNDRLVRDELALSWEACCENKKEILSC